MFSRAIALRLRAFTESWRRSELRQLQKHHFRGNIAWSPKREIAYKSSFHKFITSVMKSVLHTSLMLVDIALRAVKRKIYQLKSLMVELWRRSNTTKQTTNSHPNDIEN
ncbi:CLUMA_CG019688, isoform A [Clunio marinus]|uniref:CLUMA_CG019688, isoform A n=1 Tax=Clunio marinus TaxID=568069 RepID=A0A1J1J2R2_9DIPT|nr:CLUMA_CG019688, isoform A [Clunio marinus]